MSHNLAQAAIQHLSFSEFRVHFLWAGPSDDSDVVSYFVKSIAMASNTGSESSRESSLTLSYECSSFGSVDESESEGPFLYDPIIASGSDEGGTSDLSEDISPRLLNLNVLIFK